MHTVEIVMRGQPEHHLATVYEAPASLVRTLPLIRRERCGGSAFAFCQQIPQVSHALKTSRRRKT